MIRVVVNRVTVAVGILGVVCAASLAAQTAQVTPASNVVGGVLVSGELSQPVRKAQVTLTSASPRATRTTTSDADGRFQFTNLPDGEYTLAASKPGHLQMVYGARRSGPTGPGTPIRLSAGQRIENIKFVLPKGSVITGQVTDEFGDPAYNVPVRAMRFTYDNGQKNLLGGTGTGVTDDRGIYRIAGLAPGEYLVSAVPRDTVATNVAMAEELNARMAQINAARPPSEAMPRPAPVSTFGYVPIYYPSTPSGASGGVVRVGPVEEVASIDIRLQVIQTASISGTVSAADGPVPQTRLQLSDAAMPANGVGIWFRDMRADGSFSFDGLVPGAYVLKGAGTVGGRPGMLGGDMWGHVEVSADPRGTTGVTLRMQKGVSVSGTLALGNLPPTVNVAQLRVRLVPVLRASDWEMASFDATLDAAGAFAAQNVVPARYRLAVSGLPAGWTLASAVFDQREAADYHLIVDGSRQITGGELKLVAQTAEISGAVSTATGAPAADETVVIFPSDRRMWLPQSRRIQVARVGVDGRYTLRALPPGEYCVIVLSDPEPGQWYDADALSLMRPSATTIVLGQGERRALDMKLK